MAFILDGLHPRQRPALGFAGATDQLVSEDDPYADGSVPVAVDFAARSTAGNFICGFAIITADDGADAEAGQFKVHRMEQTGIDRTLLTDGVPIPDILRQIPCYLGPDLATAFGA